MKQAQAVGRDPGATLVTSAEVPRTHAATDDHWALNTTTRCQHRCVYCFEGTRAGLRQVPAEETMRLIDAAAASVRHVIFMGAEPTLNPHLPDLIRHARSRGLIASISTNAMRLADLGYLLSLEEAGLGGIELSFPYPDAEVYAEITRAHPRGFSRLLQALENIEQVRAGDDPPRTVNVNVVVSRYNVDRLPEVIGHVASRLVRTHKLFSFKRISAPPQLTDAEYLARLYVPCGVLRERLVVAAAAVPAGTGLSFRDFPLCALPGCEHYDHDLRYWLNRVDVRQNFANQRETAPMYDEARTRAPHRFGHLCERCSLDPVCFGRGLFALSGDGAQHRPVPIEGPIDPALRARLERSPRGRRALAAGPPADRPKASPRVVGAADPARAEGASVDLEPTSERWRDFVGEVLLARVLDHLSEPLRTCVSAGSPGEIVVRDPDLADELCLRLAPLSGPGGPGFLCGRVRVEASAHATTSERVRACARAIAAASSLASLGSWPAPEEPAFLRRVWAVFGLALLPRAGEAAALVDGAVSPSEVRLRFLARERSRFEIVLLPAEAADNPYACAGPIALRYDRPREADGRPEVARIVERYAALLMGGASPRRAPVVGAPRRGAAQ